MIPDEGKPILWKELSRKEVDKLTKTVKMAIIPTAACGSSNATKKRK
jgi:hypothetical protein